MTYELEINELVRKIESLDVRKRTAKEHNFLIKNNYGGDWERYISSVMEL